jgi:CSLREA domain-containing protein
MAAGELVRVDRWGRRARPVALLCVAVLGGSLLVACQHIVKELTVTSTADAVDVNPGDGVCATSGAVCTLRAAVQEANATPLDPSKFDAVEIHLAPGATYQLSIFGIDQTAVGGDLDLNASVLIDGQGATVRSPASDRAFDVRSGGTHPDVVIQSLTIQSSTGFDGPDGGAIRFSGGTLDVESTTFTSSLAMHASGAIHQTATAGMLTVNRSSFVGGFADSAGAITTNASALITASSFTANEVQGSAGAIHQVAGTLTLDGDTFEQNEARAQPTDRGGAIVSEAGTTLTITRSTFSHNSAAQGNALWSMGTTTIRSSTFSDGIDGGAFIIGRPTGTVSIGGSIVGAEADLPICSAPLTSLGYNEVQDDSCGLLATGDRIGTPVLDDLADNGGSVLTRLPNGDLLDAIPPATAGLCDTSTPQDQRGAPKPSGTGCDIGAVERQPTDP